MKQEKQTILKHYIRDEKRNPQGLAVLVRQGDKVSYGFALVNPRLDTFTKKEATQRAIERAMMDKYNLPVVPERESKVLDAYLYLQDRGLRYFKDLDPENVVLRGHLSTLPWEE